MSRLFGKANKPTSCHSSYSELPAPVRATLCMTLASTISWSCGMAHKWRTKSGALGTPDCPHRKHISRGQTGSLSFQFLRPEMIILSSPALLIDCTVHIHIYRRFQVLYPFFDPRYGLKSARGCSQVLWRISEADAGELFYSSVPDNKNQFEWWFSSVWLQEGTWSYVWMFYRRLKRWVLGKFQTNR